MENEELRTGTHVTVINISSPYYGSDGMVIIVAGIQNGIALLPGAVLVKLENVFFPLVFFDSDLEVL